MTGHSSTGRRRAGPGSASSGRRSPVPGRGTRKVLAAVASAAALLVLAGCGSSDGRPDVPTRAPATPVAGADTPAAPAGTVILHTPGVRQVAAMPAADGALLAVQTADPAAIAVYGTGDTATPIRTIPLPGGASPMTSAGGGEPAAPTALVPVPGGMLRVDLSTGAKDAAHVDGDAVSATALPDGRYAVGTAEGAVHILGPDLTPERTVTGFVSADSLAAAGDDLLVLDAHQTSLTEVDPDSGDKGAALRVGAGATRVAADGDGRVIALDTDGGQILAYGLDPLVNRQLAPIGASPAALAVDPGRGVVWVTFTGTDEVAAFDLSSGEPVEKHRFPTVAFPTSVDVGPSGAVYVGSGHDGGVGRIAPEEIR